MPIRIRKCFNAIVLAIAVAASSSPAHASPPTWEFRLSFPAEVHPEPFTGRVYIFFSRSRAEPRTGFNWFRVEPMISLDVQDWSPGTELLVNLDRSDVHRYPANLNDTSLQGMRAQAVMRLQPWEREVGEGAGNATGPVVLTRQPGPVSIRIDRLIPRPRFRSTQWTSELRVPSPLLSRFHGRDVDVVAAVTVPRSYYSRPDRRYPVILEVPGFGGRHDNWVFRYQNSPPEKNRRGVEFIRVALDPNCPLGHHVFANSENNGPWGDALVQEFLPALDAKYRTVAKPSARFLTGHSSGGWSTLWLQIQYPQYFGGTWSTAPDSVDFRDFQGVNIYQDKNVFFDDAGKARPIARSRGRVAIWWKSFSQMEEVLGPGEQLHSFEAVFSPRGEDGRPLPLWDRNSGEIFPEVAAAWKAYDIREQLARNWDESAPLLRGKLHVFVGTEDTFYLDGAVRLLQEFLSDKDSGAVVEFVQGRDHFNLLYSNLQSRIEQQMADQYLKPQTRVLQNR